MNTNINQSCKEFEQIQVIHNIKNSFNVNNNLEILKLVIYIVLKMNQGMK